jgi:hypothetical protein
LRVGISTLLGTGNCVGAPIAPAVARRPSGEVCKYRNATRDPDERFAFDRFHQLEADMKHDLGDVGWWFDTSALTPEES